MKEMGNATMAPKAIQAHSEAASSVPLPPTGHNHAIPSNAHIWKGSSTVCVVAAALKSRRPAVCYDFYSCAKGGRSMGILGAECSGRQPKQLAYHKWDGL